MARNPAPGAGRRWRGRAAIAVAAAAVSVVAACGSSGTTSHPSSSGAAGNGKPVQIDFWTWVPNPQNAIDAFNRTHPNIHVSLTEIPGGAQGGNAKLLAALKAHNAPCTAQVEYQGIPDYLIANGLMDIGKYVKDDASKFVGWQWQQGVYGDKVYAIPQASGPMALYYRTDMFTAAGITSPPTTWAEYQTDAQKIHAKFPKSVISTSPTSYGNYLAALAQQNGATWFSHTEDTWHVAINGADTKQVANYWGELINKGLAKNENPFGAGFNNDLATGTFAAYIGASWTDALIRQAAPKQSGKWRVAPLPQWSASGAQQGGNWGGSSTAVLTGCKYPQQAAEFAVWLNSDPTSVSLLTEDGAGWPAVADLSKVTAINNAPEVFKFYGGQNINTVFAAADKLVNKKASSIPTAAQAYAELTTRLATSSDVDNVLDQVQQQTVNNLKAKNLKVSTP